MNIFILDRSPEQAARDLCDAHIVKMILETAQMLSTCIKTKEPKAQNLYKATHLNHPCTVWVRESSSNFEWLLAHGTEMSEEYTRRYKKKHKSYAVIEEAKKYSTLFDNKGLTPFVQCMPDLYKKSDAVKAYRDFYYYEKRTFAVWRYSATPDWYKDYTKVVGV